MRGRRRPAPIPRFMKGLCLAWALCAHLEPLRCALAPKNREGEINDRGDGAKGPARRSPLSHYHNSFKSLEVGEGPGVRAKRG